MADPKEDRIPITIPSRFDMLNGFASLSGRFVGVANWGVVYQRPGDVSVTVEPHAFGGGFVEDGEPRMK